MRIYVIILFLLFLAVIYSLFKDESSMSGAKKLEENNSQKIRIIAAITMLILIAGLRKGIGTDYSGYAIHYNALSIGAESGSNFEIGYNVLNYILSFIGFSDQWLFFLLSAFLVLSIAWISYKNSVNIDMSIYLFVALYFYFASFNIIRQFIAIPIILLAFEYLCQKDFVKYFACVILASLFHYSALIMLPVYFLVSHQFSRKVHIVIVIICFFLALFGRPVISAVMTILPRYQVYFDFPAGSAWCDIAILSLNYWLLQCVDEDAKKENVYNVYVNFSLLSIVVSFLTFTNILFARITPYFYIFSILSIPFSLMHISFDVRLRRIISLGTILITFLYCLYYLMNNNAGIVPYS